MNLQKVSLLGNLSILRDIEMPENKENWVRINDTSDKPFKIDEGGVVIKAPNGFSWPVIWTVVIAIASMIFNVSSFYFRQGSFNDDMTRRMTDLSENVRYLRENTYNKNELNLEIKRIDQNLANLQSDVDRLERTHR